MKKILNKIKDIIIVLSGFVAFLLIGNFVEWVCLDSTRAKVFAIIGGIFAVFTIFKFVEKNS